MIKVGIRNLKVWTFILRNIYIKYFQALTVDYSNRAPFLGLHRNIEDLYMFCF